MVHLRKHCIPNGEYSKLKPKKYEPFRIRAKINDNSYIIDLPVDWRISNTFNVSNLYEYFPLDDIQPSVVDLPKLSLSKGNLMQRNLFFFVAVLC